MRWSYREGGAKALFLFWMAAAAFLVYFCPETKLTGWVYGQFFPTAAFCMDALAYGEGNVTPEGRMMDMVAKGLPLYSYSISYFGDGMMNQYYKEYVEILMQEAREGTGADIAQGMGWGEEGEAGESGGTPDTGAESGEDGAPGNGAAEDDGTGEQMPDENLSEDGRQTEDGEQAERLNEEGSLFAVTDGSRTDDESYLALLHTGKVQTLSLEDYREFDALVGKFYTVDANTYTTKAELNAEKFAAADMRMEKGEGGPQILIYHTHSHEGYVDSTAGDEGTFVVGAGERLAKILREEYGYEVLHHTGCYDDNRDYAYSYALPALERILAENPSIEVVIDLHRDSVAEKNKLVMDVAGRPTARFMFFNGLSRVQSVGEIGYLPNENLQGNLAFSFQMQKVCEEYYPGLARKIYLKGYRYNMHLKPRTLLVELGAQNNTVEEAMNACAPLARVLAAVLGGE